MPVSRNGLQILQFTSVAFFPISCFKVFYNIYNFDKLSEYYNS